MAEVKIVEVPCACGVNTMQLVIEEGKAFVALAMHGATRSQLHDWCVEHREILRPLLNISTARMLQQLAEESIFDKIFGKRKNELPPVV